ncbi:MAG: T9SS type A sorting domain-containing protein [Sporocytophaga sp.]|uniref:T9SS type A sorting domain-containing protein n=1 Tax=Sporocytophaga sp. TaxID=2231183 RepID=UPI001B2412AF|nr:T9SS type A sorting domain-containing protein [Sporocytophaga sp.]MBO9702560.1 T9SS type A sorting domain-containing protein [Sporocytophaga sp.]
MQKLLLTILLVLFFQPVIQAQIQLNIADLPHPDDAYNVYYRQVITENLQGLTPGAAGDNIVWDFSSLSGGIKDSTIFVNPITFDSELSKLFPSASLASITVEGVFYFQISEDGLRYHQTFLGGKDVAAYEFSPSLLIMDLPINIGNYYSGEGERIVPIDASTRMRISTAKKDTADAWGILKTPTNDFDALRLISYITYTTYTEVKTGDTWTLLNQDINKVIEYNWWAKDVGKEVLKFRYIGENTDSLSHVNWFTGKEIYMINSLADPSLTKEMLVVGPNPTSGPMQIFSASGSKIVSISIKDIGGKTVYNRTSREPISFVDLSSLSEGVYYLELKDENGITIIKKVSLVK